MSEDRFCSVATASGLMIFRPQRADSRGGAKRAHQMNPIMLALLLDTPQACEQRLTLLERTWTITRMKALATASKCADISTTNTIRGLVARMEVLMDDGDDGDAATLCFLMILSMVSAPFVCTPWYSGLCVLPLLRLLIRVDLDVCLLLPMCANNLRSLLAWVRLEHTTVRAQ